MPCKNLIDFGPMDVSVEIASVICAMAGVARNLAADISLGVLAGDHSVLVGENSGGDGQKALDLIADDAFIAALKGSQVKYYASEEQDIVLDFGEGCFGLAIDPLDGSSNIDVNVSIGTIFSIVPALDDANKTFYQSGRAQLAGGYFIFGPQCALVMTTGNGTHQLIYDRKLDQFRYAGQMRIPKTTHEFAINASNHRHWHPPIRAYVDDCLAGERGARSKNYNMRWVASLVAETHRILSRGGVFLYPSDDRTGYNKGRLRLIYECLPIAFIVEQAEGKASDMVEPLLDLAASELHERTGLAFGSAEEVERIAHYHDLPPSEVSPLFNKRGLFSQ